MDEADAFTDDSALMVVEALSTATDETSFATGADGRNNASVRQPGQGLHRAEPRLERDLFGGPSGAAHLATAPFPSVRHGSLRDFTAAIATRLLQRRFSGALERGVTAPQSQPIRMEATAAVVALSLVGGAVARSGSGSDKLRALLAAVKELPVDAVVLTLDDCSAMMDATPVTVESMLASAFGSSGVDLFARGPECCALACVAPGGGVSPPQQANPIVIAYYSLPQSSRRRLGAALALLGEAIHVTLHPQSHGLPQSSPRRGQPSQATVSILPKLVWGLFGASDSLPVAVEASAMICDPISALRAARMISTASDDPHAADGCLTLHGSFLLVRSTEQSVTNPAATHWTGNGIAGTFAAQCYDAIVDTAATSVGLKCWAELAAVAADSSADPADLNCTPWMPIPASVVALGPERVLTSASFVRLCASPTSAINGTRATAVDVRLVVVPRRHPRYFVSVTRHGGFGLNSQGGDSDVDGGRYHSSDEDGGMSTSRQRGSSKGARISVAQHAHPEGPQLLVTDDDVSRALDVAAHLGAHSTLEQRSSPQNRSLTKAPVVVLVGPASVAPAAQCDALSSKVAIHFAPLPPSVTRNASNDDRATGISAANGPRAGSASRPPIGPTGGNTDRTQRGVRSRSSDAAASRRGRSPSQSAARSDQLSAARDAAAAAAMQALAQGQQAAAAVAVLVLPPRVTDGAAALHYHNSNVPSQSAAHTGAMAAAALAAVVKSVSAWAYAWPKHVIVLDSHLNAPSLIVNAASDAAGGRFATAAAASTFHNDSADSSDYMTEEEDDETEDERDGVSDGGASVIDEPRRFDRNDAKRSSLRRRLSGSARGPAGNNEDLNRLEAQLRNTAGEALGMRFRRVSTRRLRMAVPLRAIDGASECALLRHLRAAAPHSSSGRGHHGPNDHRRVALGDSPDDVAFDVERQTSGDHGDYADIRARELYEYMYAQGLWCCEMADRITRQ
jgi:hypothetical protein